MMAPEIVTIRRGRRRGIRRGRQRVNDLDYAM